MPSWWSSSTQGGREIGSDEERALWTEGIDALGGLGGNVLCKLSGLAMPLGSMAADVLAPWLEHAIDAFGVDRCMFASNFPVDGIHGTLRRALQLLLGSHRRPRLRRSRQTLRRQRDSGLPLLARCVNRAVQCQASVGEDGLPATVSHRPTRAACRH